MLIGLMYSVKIFSVFSICRDFSNADYINLSQCTLNDVFHDILHVATKTMKLKKIMLIEVTIAQTPDI